MSWFSKVAWKEGLFLQPHHLQQADRHVERLIEARSRHLQPYPWGFSALEIDHDLGERNLFGLRRASGVFPDGLPFDLPADSPLPAPVAVPEGSEGAHVWLTVPMAAPNAREVGFDDESSRATRYVLDRARIADSTAAMRSEQEIEIAHPRIALEVRSTPKAGFSGMRLARVVEVRNRVVILDPAFAPPVLAIDAHAAVAGWLDRVIGWVETRLAALARYAADPRAGAAFQPADYSMLVALNREIGPLRHLRAVRPVHPERLYLAFLRLAGELWTFDPGRLCPEYPAYDQDALQESFEPLLRDIQRLLSRDVGRAVRLNLERRSQDAYVAQVPDPGLLREATFVIEVAADKSPSQIQQSFAALCKVGPLSRMPDIVHSNLPGLELVHMPTPPYQIRAVSTRVYYRIDKRSALWREFSASPAIGLHFTGDWPELELEIWAIPEAAA